MPGYEQIKSEAERQRNYAEWVAEQKRPWNRFKAWLRYTRPVQWYWNWRWRSMAKHDFTDEVPF